MAKTTDLSQHFTFGQLVRYALPPIAMMVFTSIYGIVDGFFVSNFAGKTAFAGVNLIMPFIMILSSFGFMFGSGGSALVAKTLGEGDAKRANGYFSLITYTTIICGVVLAIVGAIFMEPVARFLGASDDMLATCVLYGRISMISLFAFMLQYMFQSLLITAGKPRVGFIVTVLAGCMNIVLDALFVGVLDWGVAGAAIATNVSEFTGGLVPLVYFARKNTSLLRLGHAQGGLRVIGKVAGNGSSEMVSNIASSIVGMVYNLQLMTMLGEDGVSAYGVIMYAGMIFGAIFIGYAQAVAPLMSYNYGARNHTEMQSLLRKSLAFMGISGVAMLILSHVLAAPIATIFTSYDEGLHQLTVHAFSIYAFAFLFMGFNVYGSSLFTSLNNGIVSAVTSFLRTLVFEVGSVLLLPRIIGVDGIWSAIVVAEIAAICVNTFFLFYLAPHYGYLPERATNNKK